MSQGATRLTLFYSCLALALAEASAAGAQQADTLDRIAAEALFDEGLRLVNKGQHEKACPKLEQSYQLDPGIGTLLYLADCYRSVGKKASAWMTFRQAAFAAADAGQRERERAATQFATELRPQLNQLTLILDDTPPGLRLSFDGHPMTSELLGVSFATDPGQHTVSLTAPGCKSQQTIVDIKEEPGAQVVKLEPLERAKTRPLLEEPEATPAAPANAQQDTLEPIGWLLAGAGATALGVGVGLAVLGEEPWPGPIALAGTGLAGAGAGFFILYRHQENAEVSLLPTTRGATLFAIHRF